jgi:hypothetical protein
VDSTACPIIAGCERITRSIARAADSRIGPSASVGLLDDTLDLLARSRRGLSAVGPAEQVFEVASKSRPGEVNTVTVVQGAASCTCTGFEYRGNCSHVKGVVARLAGRDGDKAVAG